MGLGVQSIYQYVSHYGWPLLHSLQQQDVYVCEENFFLQFMFFFVL